MIIEDQREVLQFLATAATREGTPVKRIETHASVVFLAGAWVWKLKRAVRYDYLDYSTAEQRRRMCEAEVRINRRTAPQIYRGVIPITRETDGSLALGGTGSPVDWIVEMSRFDQDALLDRLADTRRLDLEVMRPLASAIASLHREATPRRDHGGRAGMEWVVDGNSSHVAPDGAREAIARHGALLDDRRAGGFVRECHGDLHLRNIVMLDGTPTLFDAIEFNDEISCIDVLYDLAFLLMDLWRRELHRHANTVFNAYLGETGDLVGLPLLPLFLSCRAAVRAKTAATEAELQTDQQRRRELSVLARTHLTLADRLLHPPAPSLVAIGGFSGSGKSVLAAALAPEIGPAPGAVILRTDEIRKRLCGVDRDAPLGPEGYTPEISRRVYATAAERAGVVLRGGHAVIVDAVFARPEDRAAIEQAGSDAGVPFAGLWLDADESVLLDRVERRRHDVSDADADVVRAQVARDPGEMTWSRIDASSSLEEVQRNARTALGGKIEGP